jgi:LysR family glycine cleavage system transcriptional activator
VPARPPSLRVVVAFEAAARHESFVQAANELNLTQSAISHAMRALEERVGARLFVRVGRTMSLTHAGAQLAKRIRVSLTLLTDALDNRPQLEPRRLSIGADPGILTRLLGPRIGQFQALHPDIDIELRNGGSTALLNAEIDLAIRSTQGVELGLSTRLVARERLRPVAAPSYPIPQDAAEFANELLIESREHPWSLWFDQMKCRQRIGSPALRVDTDLLAIELARSGAGICLAPEMLVDGDIQDGALVELGPASVSAESDYRVDWNPRSSTLDEIGLFLAWLTETLRPSASQASGSVPSPLRHADAGICAAPSIPRGLTPAPRSVLN